MEVINLKETGACMPNNTVNIYKHKPSNKIITFATNLSDNEHIKLKMVSGDGEKINIKGSHDSLFDKFIYIDSKGHLYSGEIVKNEPVLVKL